MYFNMDKNAAISLAAIYSPVSIITLILFALEHRRGSLVLYPSRYVFYGVLLCLSIARPLMFTFASLQQTSRTSAEFLSDVPALFFVTATSILIVQMSKTYSPLPLFPPSKDLKRNSVWADGGGAAQILTLFYFLINISLYLTTLILLFAMVTVGKDVQIQSKYSIPITIIFASGILALMGGICWVMNHRYYTMLVIGGYKVIALSLLIIISLFARVAILIWVTTQYFQEYHSHFDIWKTAILIFYFTVGEVVPSTAMAVLQFFTPNPKLYNSSDEESMPLAPSLHISSGIPIDPSNSYNSLEDKYQPIESSPNKNRLNNYNYGNNSYSNYNRLNSSFGNFEDNTLWAPQNLRLHEVLGRGGSGAIVYRCTLKEGPYAGGTFAVKIMSDCVEAAEEAIRNEILVYKALQHPNIVRYVGCDFSLRSEIRLFMEYLPTTLDSYIRTRLGKASDDSLVYLYFTPAQIVQYALQIVLGLEVLHANDIAHRDLKTGNIFVDLNEKQEIGRLLIGDFDVSKKLKNSSSSSSSTQPSSSRWSGNDGSHTANRGTENFRAPEMRAEESVRRLTYDVKVDIWSFGMILCEMITLHEPYHYKGRSTIAFDERPLLPKNVVESPAHAPLLQIFNICTQINPEDRPSATELRLRLQSIISC
eukprot:TRINITY_DN5371_c0_g1_i1.p1 TRINITY_DN5371_c0_g1~~TRINITY_DN5371_c0_g1_i1.p1  ORF type:complete len:649 (-),score=82.89 TRINITY_DN5371_c0_g1_i1:66-2012(-)